VELVPREVRELLDDARGPLDTDVGGARGVAQAEVGEELDAVTSTVTWAFKLTTWLVGCRVI
jgi:hypothetical protein